MSDIPVKLFVEEPEVDGIQEYEFAQETIKVGRGRPGKARKGVDVQLADPTAARVAAVIHVRKLDDVFIMDMGSGGTRIDGKKVGARGKLSNGTEILVGNSKITIFIGDEIPAHFGAASEVDDAMIEEVGDAMIEEVGDAMIEEVGDLGVAANVTYGALDGGGELPEDDMPTSFDAGASQGGGFSSEVAVNQWTPEAGEGASTPPEGVPAMAGGFDGQQVPSSSSFGIPEATATPGIPDGYQFYPMHQEPEGVFGPLGPTPMPLPDTFNGPNLALLLDVSDRLGKQVWYRQEKLF